MKKRFFIFSFVIFAGILSAQSRDIDYYSIGYNDASARHIFDFKYSIENLSKSLEDISSEEEKLEFIKNIKSYNQGYIDGVCKELELYDYSFISIKISDEYAVQREILDWYTSLSSIRTKTSDKIPSSVVVDIAFGCKYKDKEALDTIKQNDVKISAFLSKYFAGKLASELTTQNEQVIKNELKDRINNEIFNSQLIKDISFLQFDVMEL